jgi:hypothetical protein
VSAFHGLFTNPLLWGAVALSLLAQVATEPLDATDWLVSIAMASTVILPTSYASW